MQLESCPLSLPSSRNGGFCTGDRKLVVGDSCCQWVLRIALIARWGRSVDSCGRVLREDDQGALNSGWDDIPLLVLALMCQ